MSTYSKGPAMGYINSTHGNMETNENIINNGVNGTSVDNRRASSGSQVCGQTEGQGPGRRCQATDHNGREEDAAEMGSTEVRSRKKWTKDENKEIWRYYRMSDPAMRGYRKRVHNVWHERNNAPQTEQRLADQICGIMKNNWFSVIEREEIERQLAPNEIKEDQEEQIVRLNSQDEDNHSNTPPATRPYEAEGNIEYLDKIKEKMQLGSERTRIPSLKSYNQKKLKEKTKEVNDILRLIHSNSITETNNLAYAGARLVVEVMEIKIPQNNLSKRQPNQPPGKDAWKNSLQS